MELARSFIDNLSAGLRLATFRDVDSASFRCGPSQAAVLVVLSLALAAIPALAGGATTLAGFRDTGIDVAVILSYSAMLALLLERPALRREVPVMLLSLAPAGTLAAALIRFGWASAGTNDIAAGPWFFASAFYVAWVLLVHYRALEIATNERPRVALPLYGLYLAVGLIAASVAPHSPADTATVARIPAAVAEECPPAACAPTTEGREPADKRG